MNDKYMGFTLDTPPMVAIDEFIGRYGQWPEEAPFVSGTALLVGPVPEQDGSHANAGRTAERGTP